MTLPHDWTLQRASIRVGATTYSGTRPGGAWGLDVRADGWEFVCTDPTEHGRIVVFRALSNDRRSDHEALITECIEKKRSVG